MKFLGKTVGVELRPRNGYRDKDDPHCMVVLQLQDASGVSHDLFDISSHWIGEMIEVLKMAQSYMQKNCAPDRDGCGFEFKDVQEKSGG